MDPAKLRSLILELRTIRTMEELSSKLEVYDLESLQFIRLHPVECFPKFLPNKSFGIHMLLPLLDGDPDLEVRLISLMTGSELNAWGENLVREAEVSVQVRRIVDTQLRKRGFLPFKGHDEKLWEEEFND